MRSEMKRNAAEAERFELRRRLRDLIENFRCRVLKSPARSCQPLRRRGFYLRNKRSGAEGNGRND